MHLFLKDIMETSSLPEAMNHLHYWFLPLSSRVCDAYILLLHTFALMMFVCNHSVLISFALFILSCGQKGIALRIRCSCIPWIIEWLISLLLLMMMSNELNYWPSFFFLILSTLSEDDLKPGRSFFKDYMPNYWKQKEKWRLNGMTRVFTGWA